MIPAFSRSLTLRTEDMVAVLLMSSINTFQMISCWLKISSVMVVMLSLLFKSLFKISFLIWPIVEEAAYSL